MDFVKPIEMPRATHYGNNYFKVYSNKIKRIVNLFSNLEYYNFLTLETNPNVETFCEQPLKIEVVQNDQITHAIFDMWVRYTNGREELQEVKYEKELSGDSLEAIRSQEQIRREESWCMDNKLNFVVRTEKDIIKGRFYIKNLNIIASKIRRYVPLEGEYYNPRILDVLMKNQVLTINELIVNKLYLLGMN